MINLDDGNTFGLVGAQEAKYGDFTYGMERITMLVILTGGRNAQIMPAFFISEC